MSLVIILVSVGSCCGKVSVSPVIVEAMNVKKGDHFEIYCQQRGEQAIAVNLSLSLFDQDAEGSVFFLEDFHSVQKAEGLLALEQNEFSLESGGKHSVQVEVLRDDFNSTYVVLFVKPDHPGIPTRFAVLFLLSTTGLREEMSVSSWQQNEQALELTVVNKGLRHGLWQGELLCYDSGGKLGEKMQVQSGLVLAGRSRGVEVGLPDWVKRVELQSFQRGVGR